MTAGQRWTAHAALIDAFARTVVPADEWPDAAEAGAGAFLAGVAAEFPWVPAVLDRLAAAGFAEGDPFPADDPDVARLVTLVVHGYWADPGNGGNRDATSWRSLRYDPVPRGGWPVAAR